MTGKAKAAIVEFAYCGTMYQDAVKTLERKFGQSQAVVSAHLDKLNSFPPLKMHNSENVIAFSATISAMVGVFRSLKYEHDLSSAALLGQAVQKLPPNMKEAWSMHTVKKDWSRPTHLDFNEWLKDKAEAHERIKLQPQSPRTMKVRNPLLEQRLVRKFLPPQVLAHLQKNPELNRIKCNQTVSCARTTIHCGAVGCSLIKRRPTEQILLPKTNFVSPA